MKNFKQIKLIIIAFLIISLNDSCKKSNPNSIPKLGTCQAVQATNGLTSTGIGIYEYVSKSGSTIKIDIFNNNNIVFKDNHTFAVPIQFAFWDDDGSNAIIGNHESFNGKHIKDRIGNNRTIITPDGLKITCVAAGPGPNIDDRFTAITIYDGAIVHHINLECNKIEYSGSSQTVADYLDQNQADGETSTYSVSGNNLTFYNIYTENTLGDKVMEHIDLSGLDKDNPTQVTDYYDDSRLPHT